jgi:hypothetical protein
MGNNKAVQIIKFFHLAYATIVFSRFLANLCPTFDLCDYLDNLIGGGSQVLWGGSPWGACQWLPRVHRQLPFALHLHLEHTPNARRPLENSNIYRNFACHPCAPRGI